MYTIELLAPAKNLQIGQVAISAGADAVYIGGPSFGARKAAGNSLEDIEALCRYAHLFSARVLVTLNTLLHDDEMQEAVRLAYEYRRIGVDAIIIQDLRLARLLFATGDFSGVDGGIRLHASTQCDNRTADDVIRLQNMGFRRVVLARELSYSEIADIRRQTTCELEGFVHGALCVSYSGACYLSEATCGRSANRGECAQMCRLTYDVLDENRQTLLSERHILSLRDLDRSAQLHDLIAAGVTTLKIEGRLKDEDYVRNVVAFYRQLLDSMPDVQPASKGICRRSFVPNPEKTFHRGATDYFSFSRPDSLVNQDTPKSTGEYLGIAPLPPSVIAQLHNGDGITYQGEGFYWPNPRIRIPAGTPVFRNLDVDFQRQLSAKDACTRTLPVRIIFASTPTGYTLTMASDAQRKSLSDSCVSPDGSAVSPDSLSAPLASSAGDAVSLSFPCEHTPAQNAERAEAVVRQQLSKLGGTALEATSVSIEWDVPSFLPASQLNEWRRLLAEAFIDARCRPAVVSVPAALPSIAALEPLPPMPAALMTCRYCILHELGCCKRKNPRKTGIPTYLRRGSLLLRIQTDCARCEMQLLRVE